MYETVRALQGPLHTPCLLRLAAHSIKDAGFADQGQNGLQGMRLIMLEPSICLVQCYTHRLCPKDMYLSGPFLIS